MVTKQLHFSTKDDDLSQRSDIPRESLKAGVTNWWTTSYGAHTGFLFILTWLYWHLKLKPFYTEVWTLQEQQGLHLQHSNNWGPRQTGHACSSSPTCLPYSHHGSSYLKTPFTPWSCLAHESGDPILKDDGSQWCTPTPLSCQTRRLRGTCSLSNLLPSITISEGDL